MRYRVRLIENLKNNYVKLPVDSALRQAMNLSDASHGVGTAAFAPNQTSHCSAIKLQPVGDHQKTFYFGFYSGISAEPNTIEISREAASILNIEDEMLLEVSIEYSYEKLAAIELEPVTVEDYEIIEQNCE